ncbi:MAG: tetratricopeptide repeat protein [Cyanosarcina radialis HA8281-LM2]|jgi:tetratricopeptide (TPR) repeat protein|nr:tetratricopeptide repeat protein [Cyanosarcina radialis HA8281-LM2]
MQSTKVDDRQQQPKVRRSLPKSLVIGLSVVGIALIAVPIGWHLFSQTIGSGTNSAYRYPFEKTSSSNVTLALQKEIAFYQGKMRLDPESGLYQASLARTYLKMARATGEASWYLLAEQNAQQSLAKMPFENQGATIVLARVAEARHDFKQAIQLAESASGNEDTFSILVTSNLALGRVDKAERAANTLVDRIPTLGTLTLRALVRVAQGRDAEALQDLQQAIALEEPGEAGSSVWARTLLGRLYYKQGQLDRAEQLYRESLRILPEHPPALLNLAQLEVRRGNYQQAEKTYSQFAISLQKAPNTYDHVVLRGMSRVQALQGDKAKATELQDRAEARLREDLVGFGHQGELARLLLERGNPEDAKSALSLMFKEVGNRRDPETLSILASALGSAGRWGEAQKVMQEALRSGIRDAGLFYQAGEIEQALGNQTAANNFFQQAQKVDPTFDEKARLALGLGIGLAGLN